MKCKRCNKKNVIKHHVCYEPEKTIWLCKSCHMKEHGKLKRNGIPLHNPKNNNKLIAISPEIYEILKAGSEKSNIPLIRLADAVVTRGINFIKNPIKIAEYFSMVKDKD